MKIKVFRTVVETTDRYFVSVWAKDNNGNESLYKTATILKNPTEETKHRAGLTYFSNTTKQECANFLRALGHEVTFIDSPQ